MALSIVLFRQQQPFKSEFFDFKPQGLPTEDFFRIPPHNNETAPMFNHEYDRNNINPPLKFNPFDSPRIVEQLYFAIMLIGIGASIKLAEEWFKSQKNKEEAKKQQLSTELAYLKSQINPHFLFNSLNSIYSLTYKKSDKAPEAVLQLSKMMRYVLDESRNKVVTIKQEVEHLSDYIELQKLRLTNKTEVRFEVNLQNEYLFIEPMLLIAFVENAFKHGTDSVEKSLIDIRITTTQQGLIFESKNTIAKNNSIPIESPSGMGLSNVKKRLELLYPDTHQLTIKETENEFCINLNLILRSNELFDR